MRKFRKQLDEKTRMLQADIKKHQDALEMISRQLQAMQESKFQVRGNQCLVSGRRERRKGP